MTFQFSDPSAPIYFWREFENPYGFLSQWYNSTFTAPKHFQRPDDEEKEDYRTAEMWMMVQKARLFGDEEIGQEMRKVTEPRKHQALGRKVKNFDKDEWDKHKAEIVEQGNYYKFTCEKGVKSRLRKLLLETGDRELVEASPYDRIWGIGYSAANAPSSSRKTWGENLLGKAIMRVRQRFREENAAADGKSVRY